MKCKFAPPWTRGTGTVVHCVSVDITCESGSAVLQAEKEINKTFSECHRRRKIHDRSSLSSLQT